MQKGYGGVGKSLSRRTWVKLESGIYSAYCIMGMNLSMERFLGQSPVCAPVLLRVPWTARRSDQSILKEISPEYSLEGLDAEAETLILWLSDGKN